MKNTVVVESKCIFYKCDMFEQNSHCFFVKLVKNKHWVSFNKYEAGRCYQLEITS